VWIKSALYREAVVDDSARAFGVFERALLIPDDTRHRVARLSFVRREDACAGEVLGYLVLVPVVDVSEKPFVHLHRRLDTSV
jgi:hypothetical protein